MDMLEGGMLSTVFAAALAEPPPISSYGGPAWSPYLVGALVGLLTCASMPFAGKPIGASSAYATIAGLIGKAVARKPTERTKYYKEEPPKLDYSIYFIAATAVGAFLAAWHGGELTGRFLPEFWSDRFGEGASAHRALFALTGGILMALGARLAGGCTSGHGISGSLQLSLSSWLSLICFFIGGVVVAHLLYPGGVL
ncbi:YeeE/YedE thiosulfate transporter family protein [Pelagicoccus sp. SDUM812002]|uniref:YeeE/YedE thiosulfate transporter family protein n=1 Tax=Pelagicoccus sp. SDUM812002 TaxID=3041266 RepID=UPI00280F3F78|nr:YeeE/YedE thiosulfate transporter family protein [Pelagicoccus sp. SDUM812002]MDQ8184133.1 YeeE/YedE thiosulfate transporter family protein [Pelagicoccus sp. SDUM812002]